MLTLKQKLFFFISISAVVVALVLAASLFAMQKHLERPVELTHPELLQVEPGATINTVIADLESLGVLKSQWRLVFKLWLKLNNQYHGIKVGTYEISSGDSALAFLHKLVKGEEKQFSLTLVEGHNWKQWQKQLKDQPGIVWPDNEPEHWLKDKAFPEGWLMPDTYHYTANTQVQAIVNRAHKAMKDYLASAWDKRDGDLPYQSPYEVLIMASIIEKETGLASERARIARVFINRLNKRMRLQTDPTIIYGMGDQFDGNIRRRDIRAPTPYNTYVIKGLPPTPIAMPGREAIDAALHPEDGEELYFVSRGDGSHVFSKTLAQHNAAVRRYQLKNRE